MLVIYGPSEYDDLPCASWQNRKPPLGRDHICKRPQSPAQSPDFHPQPRAIGLIDTFRAECSRHESFPPHVCRPRFGESPCKYE